MRIGVDFKSVSLNRPGIGAFLARLFSEVARQQPRHQFILFGPQSALQHAPQGAGFETRAVEIRGRLGRFRLPFYDQVQLPLALRKEEIDVFFCPYVDAPLLFRKPLILTVYDLVLLRFPEIYPPHSRLYFNSLLRMHLRKACRIMTSSEFSKQDLVEFLGIPAEKIRVLPCTVPAAFLRDVSPEEINAVLGRLGIHSEYVLYTGGMDARKNLARLFGVIGRLNRQGPRRYLLVLTGANFLPHRSQWETEGLSRDVVLTGSLPEEEMAALYRGANLMVYPSLWEGFGLPVMEAIACGTPIAASRAASIPEVGGEAAVYFDPCDVDDMARVISEVLRDPELRARLSVAARKRSAVFQSNRPADVFLSMFDELAGTMEREGR